MGYITVVSTLKTNKNGTKPLALRERDDRHPEGEVWITSGDKEHEVFETPAVIAKIKQGVLKEVKSDKDNTEKAKAKETDLPEDFPYLAELKTGKVTTVEALLKLKPDQVVKFKGLDAQKVEEIGAALKALTEK